MVEEEEEGESKWEGGGRGGVSAIRHCTEKDVEDKAEDSGSGANVRWAEGVPTEESWDGFAEFGWYWPSAIAGYTIAKKYRFLLRLFVFCAPGDYHRPAFSV